MTKMYLIRHCESTANIEHRFNGAFDSEVSELGAKQLEFLAQRFKDVHIDAVYSSPLKRAMATAFAAIGEKGITPVKREDLMEVYGGVCEGRTFAECFEENPYLKECWYEHIQDFFPEGGESMFAAYDRIYNAVLEIARENPDKTVAVATHGGVLRLLMTRLLFGEINKVNDLGWCVNTAVTLLEIDDSDNIKIIYYYDYKHLPNEYNPKASKVESF